MSTTTTTIVPNADGRPVVKRAAPELTREERYQTLVAAAAAHPSPSRRMTVEAYLAMLEASTDSREANLQTAARIRARLSGRESGGAE